MTGGALARATFDPGAREARLVERARELVDLARAGGADDAEVCASHVESVEVQFEKGDLKLTTVDEAASLGLRVFHGHRTGFASTNQGDRESLRAAAADANALASLSPPDPANRLPEPPPVERAVELVSPDLVRLTVDDVVDRARDLVGRIVAVDPRIALERATVELSTSSVAVCSSRGVRATESDAALAMSVFGMAVDGDDVGGFDLWGEVLRDPQRFDAAAAETVARFTSGVLGNLGTAAAESYRGPVLFSPAAFLSVFVSPLVAAASAIAVQRGRSALAGKLGERIASESVTITDDPHDRRLAGAASFDREGVPTRRFPIVSRGVLAGLLYNAYAAAVDGVESTGHAAGDARNVPGLGCHSLSVAPGAGGDRDALLAALGRGLVVQRFSGSVDPASGDFSGVAKSARWVEDGRIVRPVRETLFSGNAFALLPRVIALSSHGESVMGRSLAPWALVDGVSVTAG